jgi:dipeptide/tripeptide permease
VQTEVDWAAGFGIPAAAAAAATLAYGGGYAARLYRGSAPTGSGAVAVCRLVWAWAKGAVAPARRTKETAAPAPAAARADARQLAAMAPVWLSLLGWNLAYCTASTVMVQQADSMVGEVGALTVPPAAMFLVATLTLLAAVPLYERVALPRLQRANRVPTTLQRTGAACVAITLAQVAAAAVERVRLSRLGDTSILWLIPQYALVGVAEFFYVGAIEFW